jgi:hypothetical protein
MLHAWMRYLEEIETGLAAAAKNEKALWSLHHMVELI